METRKRSWKKIFKRVLAVLGVLIIALAFVGWYKLFREEDQPPFKTPDERFKYGSITAENSSGLPYWVWLVLPRMFPEYLPGPGGYRSLGIVWEEGQEMPVGFTKKVVGFPRVANNCAVCHTAMYRIKEEETPRIAVAGPNHTSNVQNFLRFLTQCASDPRFNASDIMTEINAVTKLSWLDKLLYRYLIIPQTKQALLKRRDQFAWMNRPGWPDWGPGRDDPMNLTKYFMTNLPIDNSVGSADFPSVWNLKIREGKSLNWDGATPAVRSVLIDSALGLGAQHGAKFLAVIQWLQDYLDALPPPSYPYPVDQHLAAEGKGVFNEYCASCHGLRVGSRVGTVIDINEIQTDRHRLDTWTQQAADAANAAVEKLGIHRVDLVKTNGYVAVPLDGIWLRAPYLHNGSVPNIYDLLQPAEKRTSVFYRGYDAYDPTVVGFDTQSDEAKRTGFRFDTSIRGNGNQGHLYGADLTPKEKTALMEYLKTF